MFPQLLIRAGGRTGHRIPLEGSIFRVGRRQDLEVSLHPERDLEVSALHAEIRAEAHGWSIRDLGSRNGTFLNGRVVGGAPVPLRPGDEVRLGPRGPVLELRVLQPRMASGETRVSSSPETPPSSPGEHPHPEAVGLPPSSRPLLYALVAAALVVVTIGGIWALATSRERAAWERERAELTDLADSLLEGEPGVVGAPHGELEELEDALARSRAELEQIRAELAAIRATRSEAMPPSTPPAGAPEPPPMQPDPDLDDLERRLRDATTALERQQLAAALDFEAIEGANRPAVALIFAEHTDGRVVTGTAFAMEASGRLITSRHVVLGDDRATPARRIAIQFSDSSQIFPGRLVAASPDWDLAVVDVENVVGSVPVVSGLNLRPDTLPPGTPLATLGFPLGGAANGAPDGPAAPARPLLSAGILLERTGQELRFQGYGEPGASGSPIFDADGQVVAILFGGIREGEGRIVLAVPAPVAAALLQSTSGAGR
ncbi:MAG: FHA domain-containing protein [Gemmatimonadales bacterium]|nr:MAG: FHA domain-containing protein [Gemmatimonadales bacterium]